MADALSNVLAFEAYDTALRRQLVDVFEAHFKGIKSDLESAFGAISGSMSRRSEAVGA